MYALKTGSGYSTYSGTSDEGRSLLSTQRKKKKETSIIKDKFFLPDLPIPSQPLQDFEFREPLIIAFIHVYTLGVLRTCNIYANA